MNDTDRQNTIAMIHIGTWGSTSYPPTAWEGFAHAESSYAPEWISESELGCDRDDCVTVLDYSLGEPKIPEGYRIAYQFQAGEHDCPECGPGTGDYEGKPETGKCELCKGDGIICSGEECTVLVLAPRYSYGSGSAGCLFDDGPHFATSIDAAAEALIETFGEYLQDGEDERLLTNLKAHGSHRFESPDAGAEVCTVDDLRK